MFHNMNQSTFKSFCQRVRLYNQAKIVSDIINVSKLIQMYDRELLRKYSNTIYEFSSPENIHICGKTSVCNDSDVDESSVPTGTYEFERPFIAEINDGRVLSQTGICTTNNYTLILDSANSREDRIHRYLKHHQYYAGNLLWNQLIPQDEYRDGYDMETATSFIRIPDPIDKTRSKDGYSHWIQSYLTRLEAIENYTEQTGREPQVIIEENPPEWLIESLEFFGYGDKIVYWDPTEEIRVKNLVVPSVRRLECSNNDDNINYKILSEQACKWLRAEADQLLEKKDDSKFADNVFISREDADRRQVGNRSEINDTLQSFEFEAYELTELTFPEQVELFSQAEKIVGVHGAGFANLVFASDCEIIEMIGDTFKPTYYIMAEILNLDYQMIRGKSISESNTPVEHRDILVDVDQLKLE